MIFFQSKIISSPKLCHFAFEIKTKLATTVTIRFLGKKSFFVDHQKRIGETKAIPIILVLCSLLMYQEVL